MSRTGRLTDDGKTLVLTLDGKETRYALERLEPDTRIADPAFNLIKLRVTNNPLEMSAAALESGAKEEEVEEERYHLFHDSWGWHCTCADANFRKRRCKHLASFKALGLLNLPEKKDVVVPSRDN